MDERRHALILVDVCVILIVLVLVMVLIKICVVMKNYSSAVRPVPTGE
jgi:hypothetical protein